MKRTHGQARATPHDGRLLLWPPEASGKVHLTPASFTGTELGRDREPKRPSPLRKTSGCTTRPPDASVTPGGHEDRRLLQEGSLSRHSPGNCRTPRPLRGAGKIAGPALDPPSPPSCREDGYRIEQREEHTCCGTRMTGQGRPPRRQHSSLKPERSEIQEKGIPEKRCIGRFQELHACRVEPRPPGNCQGGAKC